MRTRSILCTIMAIAMVMSLLAGCRGNQETKSEDKTTAKTVTEPAIDKQQQDTEAKKYEKRYKFTFSNIGEEQPEPDNAFFNYLKEKFNVEFEMWPVEWGNWSEKNRVWLSSGDTPDIMNYNFSYGDYVKYAKQGVLKALPALDKWPNIQKVASSIKIVDKLKIDGVLYGWPKKLTSNSQNELDTKGFHYRKDWARKVGIPDDKNTFTEDEFYDFLKKIVSQDPGNFGKDKVVAYFPACINNWNPEMLGLRWHNPYYGTYKKVDGKYVWGASLPETLEGIKFAKRLYDEGLLYKDYFTAKGEDPDISWTSGRSAVFAGVVQLPQLLNWTRQLEQNVPGFNADTDYGLLHIVDANGGITTGMNSEFWNVTLFKHSLNDEQMNRILDMFDWILSEEGTKIFAYGIPGKDWGEGTSGPELKWPKDDKGQLIPPDYDQAGFIHIAICEPHLFELNPAVKESSKKMYRDYLDYKKAHAVNIFMLNYDLQFLSTELYSKFVSFDTETDNAVIKIIMTSKDVEKDWNEFLASMESKVKPVVDEINASIGNK